MLLNDLPTLAGPVPESELIGLIRLVDSGKISLSAARREVLPRLVGGEATAESLLSELGLERMGDDQELGHYVRQVLSENAEKVNRLKAGKRGLVGWFVGEVVKRTAGRADPQKVRELIEREVFE